jgi:predicted RNA binding protein YcfA (HicA-like mRNA interferase family)
MLEHNGFRRVRQQGSHCIMQKRTEDSGTVTVPVPMHATLRRGTLQSIVRQSGLLRNLFETE